MDTRHLVDPELLVGLERMPSFDFSTEALPQIRAGLAEMLRQQSAAAPPSDVRVEELRIPGPSGAPDVRVLIYSPPSASALRAGYLQIHGGGYVLGSPEMNEIQNKALVSEIGCVVVSVDYRLAPETPHPGPVEDCYAALKWLHDNADGLGVDPGAHRDRRRKCGWGTRCRANAFGSRPGRGADYLSATEISDDRRPHRDPQTTSSLCRRIRLDCGQQPLRLAVALELRAGGAGHPGLRGCRTSRKSEGTTRDLYQHRGS